MNIKTIDNTLSVSGQLQPDDVSTLKKQGINSIICNRPDREEAEQADYKQIQDKAVTEGLACVCIPVTSGHINADHIKQFGQALKELPHPIHAYCRSGTRCSHLWGLSQVTQGADREKIIQQAANAGYDLSKVI
ncbi:MAG: TIGR01244 family phosphatase [Cellvibrionaceae bacterium]|nr:TIGR01244 family phosphatase [Cellvibrionaceae bacterium]